jgi:hypothetical protein
VAITIAIVIFILVNAVWLVAEPKIDTYNSIVKMVLLVIETVTLVVFLVDITLHIIAFGSLYT